MSSFSILGLLLSHTHPLPHIQPRVTHSDVLLHCCERQKDGTFTTGGTVLICETVLTSIYCTLDFMMCSVCEVSGIAVDLKMSYY